MSSCIFGVKANRKQSVDSTYVSSSGWCTCSRHELSIKEFQICNVFTQIWRNKGEF